MKGPASFAQYLPYWTTLGMPHGPDAKGPTCVLVLKDGTLCIGYTLEGLDIYAAEPSELNARAEHIGEALAHLPAGYFVQVVYTSGHSSNELLDRYEARSRPGSDPLLARGRQARADMLGQCTYLTRTEVTLWIGVKRALPAMTKGRKASSGLWARMRQYSAASGAPKGHAARVDRACAELRQQAQAFVERLALSDIAARPMDEAEVLSACHAAVNPSLGAPETIACVRDSEDLAAYQAGGAYVLPGPTLASQLPMSCLRYNDTQLVLGEPPIVQRVLGIAQLGATTHPESLHGVLYERLPHRPMRLVVTHEATDVDVRRAQLMRRQKFIASFVGGQFVDHAARAALGEHDAVLDQLDARGGKLFETSVLVVVSGQDVAEVEEASRSVIDALAEKRIRATVHHEEQLTAWLASLPGYGTRAPYKHTTLHHNCAHLWPYWVPSLGDAEPDLVFENRQRGIEGLSVRLGPQRENAGAIVIGATGSGKTFLFSALFKYGCLDLGGHVVLADMKGPANSSYRPLCALLGGTYVSLEHEPGVSFNPFPPHDEVFSQGGVLQPHTLEPCERIICMMTLADSGHDPDIDYARSVAKCVIRTAYGATQKKSKAPARHVTLTDLHAAFKGYEPPNDNLKRMANGMRERLELRLGDDNYLRLFNKPESLNLSSPFIVFDFHNMDKDKALAALLVSVLTSRIEAKMERLPKTTPKLFGFDEAWALFDQSPEACALLSRLYRVSRSYGAFCYVLTQNYNVIVKSAAKDGIMNNTSLLYLMRHMADHHETSEALELLPRQRDLFRSLQMVPGQFAEFLLVDKHEHKTHLLQYAPTPFDLWCDTSRPADVAFRDMRLRAAGHSVVDTIDQLAQDYPQGAPKGEASWPSGSDAGAAPGQGA